jgi:nucleolar protein 16
MPWISKASHTGIWPVTDSIRNRNRKQTLSQNYARLGLSSKLVAPSGGVERHSRTHAPSSTANANDSLAIKSARPAKKLIPTEARVERDPTTGNILRVVSGGADDDEDIEEENPLNDPLNDLEARPPPEVRASTAIVEALEAEAAEEEARLAAKKQPRKQSTREEEWISKLVDKYGDDYGKMTRDRKLNPMQQSEGDIKRRARRWREKNGR